ncbi:unnamed protein product [Clonostachys rosea]|uniref:Uncharacterized protein n=1 Tax=Bionectria ochroleuca TaxID=29856 RepID=A0ABY6UHQ8_BIOOC|nr:unnamed protein product [Clonostachys rosea]
MSSESDGYDCDYDCDGCDSDGCDNDGYDSDVYNSDASDASSCLDSNHRSDVNTAISSNLVDDGYIDANKPFPGPKLDYNKALVPRTSADLGEELTTSPHNTLPHSQELPASSPKSGTLDVADEACDGLPADASSRPSDLSGGCDDNLKKAPTVLETDHNKGFNHATLSDCGEDTTADSAEDYAVGQVDTRLSSRETSDRDDDKANIPELWTAGPSEDQEKNGRRAKPSLSQVAKTDLNETIRKSGENRDPALRSGPPRSGGDHQAEVIHKVPVDPQPILQTDSADTSSLSKDTLFNSGDKNVATEDRGASNNTFSENEQVLDDGLSQDKGCTNIPPRTGPEKLGKDTTITPTGLEKPVVLDDPSLPQKNFAGSKDSANDVPLHHSAPEAENPGSPQSSSTASPYVDLSLGSIVKLKCDGHPFLILNIEHDENGKEIFLALMCTSRPKLWKIKQQYEHPQPEIQGSEPRKRHFIYLHGIELNPDGFVTDGHIMPTVGEVKMQGPPMPLFTYIILSGYGRFGREEFEPFLDLPRRLTPASSANVLKEWKLLGYKSDLELEHGCKKNYKESSWERPRRATGNTHERIFATNISPA